ncbi:MAG: hypothetical protein M5U08_02490 [Burkholderiales bacterium]|nr:hypothetical protein [Burkholderiales bacterium]
MTTVLAATRSSLLLLAALVGACSTPSPRGVAAPALRNPDMAQITVKREFRWVGGGTSYVHDLYDFGTGIDYNADVPGREASHVLHFVYIDRITPELFDKIEFFWISGRAPLPYDTPPPSDPKKDYERVVERIDESLLDAILLKTADLNRGGLTVNPGRASIDKASLKDRGALERVKLRKLYDRRKRVLYKVLERTEERCFGPHLIDDDEKVDLTGIRADLIMPAFRKLAPDFQTRSLDYVYGELCGLTASFELNWNARRIASLQSFEPLTWERPPGQMRLYALLGGIRIFANEVAVEAGKRYVGIYDPNNRAFVIQALD